MPDLIGKTLLDRYFLRESVGSGGMADVYLAWDKKRYAKIAIKVLRRDLANDSLFFRYFAKEAELLRKLEHPHIVRLYEFERDDDIAFIVMDWVEGTNLRRAIAEKKTPLSLAEVSDILGPVCSALNYAHENGVYHCDVKPANILLHVDGRVLLTDFGVAQFANQKGGGGTPPYMAPEQFEDEELDARTDVYELGVTLYEILSGGHLPFSGKSPNSTGTTAEEKIAWEHRNLPVPSIRQFNPALPAEIETIIRTAMDKRPDRRYPSTLTLHEAFEQVRGTLKPPPQDKPNVQQKPDPGIDFLTSIERSIPKYANSLQQISRQLRNIRPPQPAFTGIHFLGRGGEYAGQIIPIPEHGLPIGRSSQNLLRISESSVSRLHATVIRARSGVFIRDEGSTLGTYVNGQKISGVFLLKNGDVVQIGRYQVFEFRDH